MTTRDGERLPLGLYRLFWMDGSTSLAAVCRGGGGHTEVAVVNRALSEWGCTISWRRIRHMELIIEFRP